MNLETFIKRRRTQAAEAPRFRHLCLQCRQPDFGCYCLDIRKIDCKIKFVILIHPIEARRRIATGRMAHLCLENSELIVGEDYTGDRRVNRILLNPEFSPAVLYPSHSALNLSFCTAREKSRLLADDRQTVIFVIDGTWATARKTMHLSRNLKLLPRLSFSPPHQSQFQVRKQPGVECFSTIEAIHHLIDLIDCLKSGARGHDHLMELFKKMVNRQMDCLNNTPRQLRRKSDRFTREASCDLK